MPNSTQIAVGCVVKWTVGKGYGVVTTVDDRRIQVRWDNPDPAIPSQFSTSDPPLQRADFAGRVAVRRSTEQQVAVLDLVEDAPPNWHCRVFSQTAVSENSNIPEADLRPLQDNNPSARFRDEEKIGSLQKYRLREVTRWYRALNNHNDLVSLEQVQVDIKPHQVSVAHKVISNHPHRFLLCDEVGLGKTIEAGMVLKELRARGTVRRVLAIVPPNLIRQWQFEMKSKFNESFAVLNTATVNSLKDGGYVGNPFANPRFSNVLCSSRWVADPKWAQQCAEADWDLIIVDEAHHARSQSDGSRTLLYRLVRKLSEADTTRGMLFLTATPMQLNTHELYALVELLDPALFPSPEHFEQHRQAVPGLSKLVEQLCQHGFPLPGNDPVDTIAKVAYWLDITPEEAKRQLTATGNNKKKIEAIAEKLSDRHRLSEVLIRNRKAVIGGFMPRAAYRWNVELTPEERTALQAVEEYVHYGYQVAEGRNDNAVGFVMVIFQKLMASSVAAIKVSLRNRRVRIQENATNPRSIEYLDEQFEDDCELDDVVDCTRASKAQMDEEIAFLDFALEKLDAVTTDSKAEVFLGQLSELFSDHPDEKVIVFTQFRETQRYLKMKLASRGWTVNIFHGQQNPQEKDDAIANFHKGTGAQILISTEAGGEGRNLQFCHLLVNYDLPWNPMRVEQRIGRVDRIGQEHPISIFNLWVEGTIEARVLEILEHRIRIFEETVGELDPILGETEHDLRRVMRLAAEQRAQALDDLDRNTENRMRKARESQRLMGDFIMDTKSYRKENTERILGQPSPVSNDDREQFIKQLLGDVNTHIKRTGNLHVLTFREDCFHAPNTDALFPGGVTVRAVLRPDIRPDAEDVEFMAFGHRVIDAIVEQVLSEEYEGVTGTRRLFADDKLPPVSGWLFTYQFTIPSVRPVDEVVPVFVSDDGKVNAEIGRLLLQRAVQFDDSEEDIDPNDIPDTISDAESQADAFAKNTRVKLQKRAAEEAYEKSDREIKRQEVLFDYKQRVADAKVEATRKTVERIRRQEGQAARRILPAWEANLQYAEKHRAKLAEDHRQKIAEIEKHRYPEVAWALKSLGRIEVVSPR